MTEEDLSILKENYAKRLQIQNDYLNVQALQKNQKVKKFSELMGIPLFGSFQEYLEYKKIILFPKRILLNDKLIVHLALEHQGRYRGGENQQTNQIFIFMGQDKIGEDKGKYIYKDIEKNPYEYIDEDKKDEFESDKLMIYPENFKEFEGISTFEVYEKIFKEFYRIAIEENQEKAKEYIIEKYVRKNGGSR